MTWRAVSARLYQHHDLPTALEPFGLAEEHGERQRGGLTRAGRRLENQAGALLREGGCTGGASTASAFGGGGSASIRDPVGLGHRCPAGGAVLCDVMAAHLEHVQALIEHLLNGQRRHNRVEPFVDGTGPAAAAPVATHYPSLRTRRALCAMCALCAHWCAQCAPVPRRPSRGRGHRRARRRPRRVRHDEMR